MRLLMVGAGGIGGYFGARFAAHGHDVMFLARGAHLAALQERGRTGASGVAPAHLAVRATDRGEDGGRPEVIMMCTKLADLESAARQIAALTADARVVTTQARIDAPVVRTLYAALKPDLNGAPAH